MSDLSELLHKLMDEMEAAKKELAAIKRRLKQMAGNGNGGNWSRASTSSAASDRTTGSELAATRPSWGYV